jgi:hypothetical protein
MPYVTTWSYQPLVGRGWDLLDALRARVKEQQSKGGKTALQVKVVTGNGQVYQVVRLSDSLDEWQEQRRANLADPATKAFVQKIAPMVTGPASQDVFEVLVPFTKLPVTGDFLFRATHYPGPGRLADLTTTCVPLHKHLQQKYGFNVQLITQWFPEDIPVIQAVYVFKKLSGWDQVREAVRSDADLGAWLRTANSVATRHATVSVWEVLMDIPPR